MKKSEFVEFQSWYDDCVKRLSPKMKKGNLEKISMVYEKICIMYEKLNYSKCVAVLGDAIIASI